MKKATEASFADMLNSRPISQLSNMLIEQQTIGVTEKRALLLLQHPMITHDTELQTYINSHKSPDTIISELRLDEASTKDIKEVLVKQIEAQIAENAGLTSQRLPLQERKKIEATLEPEMLDDEEINAVVTKMAKYKAALTVAMPSTEQQRFLRKLNACQRALDELKSDYVDEKLSGQKPSNT